MGVLVTQGEGTPPSPHGLRVAVGDQEVVLTRTEYALLEVLRSQPRRVFTRAELVERVMPDAVVLERTIDVHVRALRKKLGSLAGMVKTVRRQGYQFVPPGSCPQVQ